MTETERMAARERAARQERFGDLASRDEAEARFHRHLRLEPLGAETVPLAEAPGRVLAEDAVAGLDVPGFDRATVDGVALRSMDTGSARDTAPVRLRLTPNPLRPGIVPTHAVAAGLATPIATGGMVPRGADAVVSIAQTETVETDAGLAIEIRRAVAPGRGIAAAGSDIARGETVLRAGQLLSSREIGMLAALGLTEVAVWRRPRVAILSTSDEVVAPGRPLGPGRVYDSNAATLAAAVAEYGGEPLPLGIAVADEDGIAVADEEAIARLLGRALAEADMALLAGSASEGAGDVAARVVGRLADPGIVVHGVALKPGKTLCLAVSGGKAVVILPGFPTSAIFTFHEFAAPVILRLGGRPPEARRTVAATLALPQTSEAGRTDYVMVSLVRAPDGGLAAYPTGKDSGSVTGFAQADGFFAVPALSEALPAASPVTVQIIGTAVAPADLVVIGSHCVGLDLLIGRLIRSGLRVKALSVGSSDGLAAARRGECDIAGIHLPDPATGSYNRPFLGEGLALIEGYGRMQGLVFRRDDPRFAGRAVGEALAGALADPEDCLMVNRNAGSGTRQMIDRLLGGQRPAGYLFQARSHNAVAVAVAQGRADWGVAIETVARSYDLGFLPIQAERYDFAVPKTRLELEPVRRFAAALTEARPALAAMGFAP